MSIVVKYNDIEFNGEFLGVKRRNIGDGYVSIFSNIVNDDSGNIGE